MQHFDVRDSRNENWFWARRELIRAHGQELGVYGVAVYCALSSFADPHTGTEARPSVGLVADLLGCSKNKVRESIKKLDELGWIGYKERKDTSGRQTSHQFYLLSCPVEEDPLTGRPSGKGDPSQHEGRGPHGMRGDSSHDEALEERGKRRDREKGGEGSQQNQPTNPNEERRQTALPLVGEEKKDRLINSLTSAGVTEERAEELVAEYTPERVARQISHFQHKVNDGQKVGPGLLVTLIEEDRTLPADATGIRPDTWEPPEWDEPAENIPNWRANVPGTEEYRESQESTDTTDSDE